MEARNPVPKNNPERWCWIVMPAVFSNAPYYDKKYMAITERNNEADALEIIAAKIFDRKVPVYTHNECNPFKAASKDHCINLFEPPYACTCCEQLAMPDGNRICYVVQRFQLHNYEGADPDFISVVQYQSRTFLKSVIKRCKDDADYEGVEKFMPKMMIESKCYPVGTCLVADVTKFDSIAFHMTNELKGF